MNLRRNEDNAVSGYAYGFATSGSVLIISLAVLVAITVFATGIFSVLRPERISSNSELETVRARALAQVAADHAISLIRDATKNDGSHKFWASQPGRITVFNADGSISSTVDLHSGKPDSPNDPDSVDLNQPGFDGTYPIASAAAVASGSAPSMAVKWINVLQNPAVPASAANPVMGRYAFWVDDESAKINLNSADGSAKNAAPGLTPPATSFGFGTPTEVDLQALTAGGAAIPANAAQDIANRSGVRQSSIPPRQFNSANEVLQVPSVPANLYSDNNFTLTEYSRSPELNIFGEPKIYLITTGTTGATRCNAMIGPDHAPNVGFGPGISGTSLTQVYPLSSQLPPFGTYPLPQYFSYLPGASASNCNVNAPDLPDYALGMRIAQYLSGINSQGQPITWPDFGTGAGGFAKKYTPRQIDSITLQILDLMQRGTFADHNRGHTVPTFMKNGFVSQDLVRGIARAPVIDKVQVTFTTGTTVISGTLVPLLSADIRVEWYLPKQFGDLVPPYDNYLYKSQYGASYGGGANYLNCYDIPQGQGQPCPLASARPFWADNLLQVNVSGSGDQAGQPAGIDWYGNPRSSSDPDQANAALYHSYLKDASGTVMGSGTGSSNAQCAFSMSSPLGDGSGWKAGDYHSTQNNYPNEQYPMRADIPGMTLSISGGLTIWAFTSADNLLDAVPLDSLHGPFLGEAATAIQPAAVIPIAVYNLPAYSNTSVTVVMKLKGDPLVHDFPGDWVASDDPSNDTIPVIDGSTPKVYSTPSTPAPLSASAGGDPSDYCWWPPQNVNVPKNQRFPSVGYLQYIHTGLMPDPAANALPEDQQCGTPFRLLNFSPSTNASQKTAGGTAYPDWAMLDLFTVPAAFQPLATSSTAAFPPAVQLTWGGATTGRINPNSTIQPFGPAVSRTVPWQAVLNKLQYSNSYDASDNPQASFVDAPGIASAIDSYVAQLGRPLRMPGEICNIPEIANCVYTPAVSSTYTGLNSVSRNDLVREIVGNLSTQSNTFTVWTVGQVIKKKPSNTNYGICEPTDTVVGESRMKFLVERHLDFGADGVPGNARNPGPDGIVGTPDDVVDSGSNANNPPLSYPLNYQYRILSVSRVND